VFFKGKETSEGEFDPIADATAPAPSVAGTSGIIPKLSDLSDRLPRSDDDNPDE
jgi:hypothetical protein